MTHVRTVTALAACALLAACTDYATFVTATDIGISADVKTQDVNIGYARTELFTGPGYPEQGEAPRAVGYINSDLHVFFPHIKQLYATGEAAELVTAAELHKPPSPPVGSAKPEDPPYYGQRRPLVFATGANVGLKLGFGAGTAPVPSSIKFGYNREEVSVIPMKSEQPVQGKPDKYAPVLASMDMNLKDTTSISNTSLGITQFFATGSAARNLAMRPEIRNYFDAQAKAAVKSSALVGTYSYDDSSEKIRAFWKPDGKTIDPANEKKIQTCMAKYNLSGHISFLIYDRPKSERDVVLACL